MRGLRKVENREKKTGHKDNFYCHKAKGRRSRRPDKPQSPEQGQKKKKKKKEALKGR